MIDVTAELERIAAVVWYDQVGELRALVSRLEQERAALLAR